MLDNRLEMIYELIPDGSVICDVGTDHCKLAAAAILRGKCPNAVATDINEGPLRAAKKLIKKLELEGRISTYLSDGLKNIPMHEYVRIDCFIIAGMGGELIRNIIAARPTKKYMVLQPMTDVPEFAEFLTNNGYNILKRKMCMDGDKYYFAFLVKQEGVSGQPKPYDDADKEELYYEYLKKEKARLAKALQGILSSDKADKTRAMSMKRLLALIEKEFNDADI